MGFLKSGRLSDLPIKNVTVPFTKLLMRKVALCIDKIYQEKSTSIDHTHNDVI